MVSKLHLAMEYADGLLKVNALFQRDNFPQGNIPEDNLL